MEKQKQEKTLREKVSTWANVGMVAGVLGFTSSFLIPSMINHARYSEVQNRIPKRVYEVQQDIGSLRARSFGEILDSGESYDSLNAKYDGLVLEKQGYTLNTEIQDNRDLLRKYGKEDSLLGMGICLPSIALALYSAKVIDKSRKKEED